MAQFLISHFLFYKLFSINGRLKLKKKEREE